MRNFIKKLFIVFFLLNTLNSEAMLYKKLNYLLSNKYFSFLVAFGGLSYFVALALKEYKADEMKKKKAIKQKSINQKKLTKQKEIQDNKEKNEKNFIDALKKRFDYINSIQNKILTTKTENLKDSGLKTRIQNMIQTFDGITINKIEEAINNIDINPTEITSSAAKKYKEKTIERREKYLNAICQEIKNINADYLPTFNQNLSVINKIIKYIQYFYLRPFTEKELNELEIKKPTSDEPESNEKNKNDGIKLIEFIDNFFLKLGINPYNVLINTTNKGIANASYIETLVDSNNAPPVIFDKIELKTILININPESVKFHMPFLNTSLLTHLLGGLFEGHQFFREIIPVQLDSNENVINLERCFFVEASTALLTKNKRACFFVLMCHMFNCIAQKHTNVNMFETRDNMPSLAERLIHTFDVYFQVHKPEKESYKNFEEETKEDLFNNLVKYEKYLGGYLKSSINHFFNQDNYPENVMLPRTIINDSYTFLPKLIPSK